MFSHIITRLKVGFGLKRAGNVSSYIVRNSSPKFSVRDFGNAGNENGRSATARLASPFYCLLPRLGSFCKLLHRCMRTRA